MKRVALYRVRVTDVISAQAELTMELRVHDSGEGIVPLGEFTQGMRVEVLRRVSPVTHKR